MFGGLCREGRIDVKDVILSLVSLGLIGAGTVLVATFFLNSGARGNYASEELQDFEMPVLKENSQASEKESVSANAPEDETLVITIPKMARVWGAVVPSAEGDDEAKLKDYAAIHLEGTGFPWEEGANVYVAGHRYGYPYTPSFLAFYDLDQLDEGDQVFVVDADGREYVYEVFRETVVSPTDFSVTEPVEGKDVLTLQTCTLPDYAQRLVVQAEKVA